MSTLVALKNCTTVGDLATMLGFKPAALGYVARKHPDKDKYKEFYIPKRSGGQRVIHAPIDSLKLAQRRLAAVLEDCLLEIETGLGVRYRLAHGYRKKHSILTNAAVHCRQRYVFNFDLADFFPSIHFGRVRGFFISNRNFELHPNIALLIAQLTCHEAKLPQGAPTSPIISNLIGNILDIRLSKLAKANGCAYTRYADDITISTSRPQFPEGIAVQVPGSNAWTLGKEASALVAACRFKVNASKTRMQFWRSRQEVNSIVVNRFPNVNVHYRRMLRAMVERLRSTNEFAYAVAELDGAGSTKMTEKLGTRNQLQGMLNFAIQVERSRLVGDAPPPELSANEKQLRRFLFYTTFANHGQPILMSEGKTDGIHLACAIKSLASSFPALAAPATGAPLIRFLRTSRSIERIFALTGGDGPLKKFVLQYQQEYVQIKGPKGANPVIVLFDNDSGASGVVSALANIYKITFLPGQQYARVYDNLYVVLTSPFAKGADHCIERCFDASTLSTTLGGKTLSLTNKELGPTEYGKAWFAEKVVKPNAATIDFAGFTSLLATLSQIVSTHVPIPKASAP
jgi:RNA-directed DNA polymerase